MQFLYSVILSTIKLFLSPITQLLGSHFDLFGCQLLLVAPLDGVLVLCLGVINIPAVALGMFSGGIVMKKYKLGIMGAAKFAFVTSLLGYSLSLFFFAMGCENSKVAGITVSYTG